MCQAHSSCLDGALILVMGERRNMVCVFDISAVMCSYTKHFHFLKVREVKSIAVGKFAVPVSAAHNAQKRSQHLLNTVAMLLSPQ